MACIIVGSLDDVLVKSGAGVLHFLYYYPVWDITSITRWSIMMFIDDEFGLLIPFYRTSLFSL